MIIFGYRGMVKLLGMVTLVCQRCGNPSAHRVVRRSRWFTLFFVPIFPFSISRAMTCTFCGQGTKLSKEQADQILGTAPAQQPIGPPAEQIAAPGQQYPGQQYPAQQYPAQQYPAQQPSGYPQQGYPQQQFPAQPQQPGQAPQSGQQPMPEQQFPGQQPGPRPAPRPAPPSDGPTTS